MSAAKAYFFELRPFERIEFLFFEEKKKMLFVYREYDVLHKMGIEATQTLEEIDLAVSELT